VFYLVRTSINRLSMKSFYTYLYLLVLAGYNMALLELVGLCKVQRTGNSLYLVIPSDIVDRLKIKQGRDFEIRYDPQTQTIVYKPKEVASG